MTMKRTYITLGVIALAIVGIVALKLSPGMSGVIWQASRGGSWLMPLVFFSALLDSVHPCSFSILLITIAFLFAAQMSRRRVLAIGGVYIAGIFLAYLALGLGILKVLHLFATPHFMGKVGAIVLIAFGALNVVNDLFPKFPVKLKLPSAAHATMGKFIERTSVVAAFALGLLVGLCQFPCMGGPYLMVIGLLRDQATYAVGFGYLVLYNLILVLPLAAVLFVAADKGLLAKVQEWKTRQMRGAKLFAGIAMIIIGLLILYV